MIRKENARPVAGTTERAYETATLKGASVSIENSIIERTRNQGKIERLLSHGERNAIISADLVNLAGLHSPRELRA